MTELKRLSDDDEAIGKVFADLSEKLLPEIARLADARYFRAIARAAEDGILKQMVESIIEDTDNFKLSLSLGFIQALKQQVEEAHQ